MNLTPWFPVQGKIYIVFGLGVSGLATIKWLQKQGAEVIAFDNHAGKLAEAQKLGAKVPQTVDKISESDFQAFLEEIPWQKISALIQSPGIPLLFPQAPALTLEARRRKVPIIGEGDLFRLAHPDAIFVGVTGTNGKSTTTALITHILKNYGVNCQMGGNIGIPMLALPSASVYVLELSSYQLELSAPLNLDVTGWLNISPDHLERHESLEKYIDAKKRIFSPPSHKQTAVIAIDDEVSKAVWQEVALFHTTVPISTTHFLKSGICVQEGWLREDTEAVMDLTALPYLKGRHNFQNVAVAYGICRALQVPGENIVQALHSFSGLAHRQECAGLVKGVEFINDSKGTNGDATARALAAFEKIYWIAGGQIKKGGIQSLSPYFPKIIHAFLIGEAQNEFAATLEGKVAYTKSGTLENAVKEAYQKAAHDVSVAPDLPHPVVLLSPACASFDQFRNFEHRGEVFCYLVQSLKEMK